MKIYLFWFVRQSWILLLSLAFVAIPSSRSLADQATGRALLAQQIRVDRPDLKMAGEIILQSLNPLSGELRFQQAKGEPRQIFAGIMRLIPGARTLLDGFFDQVDIHDLTLDGLVITVTPEGYALTLTRATIPEGVLEQVTGSLDRQKNWRLESGPLRLSNLPLHFRKTVPPMPLSYSQLQASGEEQKNVSLAVDKIRVGHLAALADPTGFFGNVLRAMGFARGLESAPIVFDRFSTTVVADAQQVATHSLLLQAPHASLSGRASMAWQPEPRQLHLDGEVTARKQPVKHFQTVIPLGAVPTF